MAGGSSCEPLQTEVTDTPLSAGAVIRATGAWWGLMSALRRLAGGWILASALTWLLSSLAPEASAQAPADWSPAGICSRACRWSGYGWGDGYHAHPRGSAVIIDTGHCTEPSAKPVPAPVPATVPKTVSASVPAPPVAAAAVAPRESVVVAEPVAEPVRRLPVFPAPRVLPAAAEPQRRLPPVAERPAHGEASSGWWRAAMLGP